MRERFWKPKPQRNNFGFLSVAALDKRGFRPSCPCSRGVPPFGGIHGSETGTQSPRAVARCSGASAKRRSFSGFLIGGPRSIVAAVVVGRVPPHGVLSKSPQKPPQIPSKPLPVASFWQPNPPKNAL